MLNEKRIEIDEIQKKIVDLLLQRKKLVLEIAKYKKTNQLPLTDQERESQLLHQFDQKLKEQGEEKYLPYLQNILKSIITENKKYVENE